jgi:ribosomal protein S18 acetylase RimI-like enzyme
VSGGHLQAPTSVFGTDGDTIWSMTDPACFTVDEAQPKDAPAIATIHLTSRRRAMPYLRRPHTDDETRDFFAQVVGDRRQAWWVVRHRGQVVGYMLIDGENLDHLYVSPSCQGRGFGSALLDWAKALSPGRLVLWTFQPNARARSFYEARGFRSIGQTDGENEEGEPDVHYEWRTAP